VIVFSGVQPTGTKHLGNFIGGFRQFVLGQERGDPSLYCIVDSHSITVPYEPAVLREKTYDLLAMFVASGLDPARSLLFRQSDVAYHTEMAWMLSSVIPLGTLNRMHQFRDKSVQQRQMVSSGLLFYPALMAADVLVYRADEVPVGEDQREHIEVMRDAARAVNARYGEDLLVVPEGRYPTVGARVLDLQEPARKMSTTGGTEQGTVFVMDAPDVVRRKFKRAVTDSGREVVRGPDKPGVTNLIEILAVVRDVAPEDVERSFEGSGYGDLKTAVGDEVAEWLAPVRERYTELRPDEARLEEILAEGSEKAHALAKPVIDDVRDAMGLGTPRSVRSSA
jgi:tryptophanyl-tRNA synthetase